ncbi:hypothetical protein [Methylococcus mesophilus]|uniref:hypothetical protein n=1 Tax=Methylococcus mesophilus TaxID=2993564 RepID=UPI00224AA0D2|nr:hypothetical protein [Methylococcus mesophilus]UZR30280.1 hypothetical protein OOT43_06475 [Methylococcus mesophilus]
MNGRNEPIDLNTAMNNGILMSQAIAAGLELLRVNRSDDPGLSDDRYTAFCWWLEQSALELEPLFLQAIEEQNRRQQQEAERGDA